MNPAGGAAIPVSIDTTRKVQGGVAIPVYGYASAPTDGRPAQGGAAIPVRVLTAADLKQNGGQWTVEGRPYALPVYTAPATTKVMGGPALAVYPVNAWPPSNAAPATPSSLLTGLQVWYELSEAGTGNRADSHTNGLTLTNNGGATQAVGVGGAGNATETTGVQYLSRASAAALQTGDIDYTVAVWCYPTNSGGPAVVAAKGVGGEYTIVETGTNFEYDLWGGGVQQLVAATPAYAINQWFLVVIWQGVTANKIYIQVNNGTIYEATRTVTPAAGNADFAIGAYPGAGFPMPGRYAKLGYWKRVLTVAERAALYNGGAGIAPYPFLNAPVSQGLANAATINVTVSGDATRILVPSSYQYGTPRPLVIYHHGNGEDYTAITADPLKHDIVDTLLLNNYIVCAGDFGGDNWGNDAALTAVTNLYNYMIANYSISRVVFLSQSMGGQSGLLSIPNVTVKGWAGIYPVANLANMFGGNAGAYAPNIRTAYGIAGDGSNYAAKTAGHDPVLLAASTFDGLRMRMYASAGDTTVTKADNSDQLATLVTGHATEHDVVACSGNHGDASHFQPNDLLAFFNRCT